MRLCFGSYLAVLVSCKAANVDNKHICEALFRSVAPNYDITFNGLENPDRVRDDATSKLLRCKQNVSKEIITPARSANPDDVADYFKRKVLVLLDENQQKHIILALKDIIANDPQVEIKKKLYGIHDDTRIDWVTNTTKKVLAEKNDFCLHGFLAGVFLYTVTATNNRSGADTVKAVDSQYVLSFTERIDQINMLDDYEKLPVPVEIVGKPIDSIYRNEFAEDFAGKVADKINALVPYKKSDMSLLVTLLAEANRKCLYCGKSLGKPLKRLVPTENCEIVYLPLSASEPEGYDNAVVLCKDTCAQLAPSMTMDEKKSLLDDKHRLADSLILLDEVSGIRIAKEIEVVLREVDKIKNVEGLAEIDITELVDVDRKICELSLREVINARMKRLFKKVQEICGRLEQEISFDTDKFGSAMKYVLETLEAEVKKNSSIAAPQEYVAEILVEKLHSQVGQKYKVACEIIVAYLVKRCDLFNETAK